MCARAPLFLDFGTTPDLLHLSVEQNTEWYADSSIYNADSQLASVRPSQRTSQPSTPTNKKMNLQGIRISHFCFCCHCMLWPTWIKMHCFRIDPCLYIVIILARHAFFVFVCCGHHMFHHRNTELCAFLWFARPSLCLVLYPWSLALPLVVFWHCCRFRPGAGPTTPLLCDLGSTHLKHKYCGEEHLAATPISTQNYNYHPPLPPPSTTPT